MNRNIVIVLKVTFAVLVYYVASITLNGTWPMLILISLSMLLLFYGNKGKRSHTYFLDSFSNVEKYLNYVETKLKGKNESKYLLYKSFGELYDGKYDGIEEKIERIILEELNEKERLMLEEIKLKILYNNRDVEGYSEKLVELTNGEFYENYQNELLVFIAPMHLLKEEYDELVELMFNIIPKQKESYRVIELEYYLALTYIAQGKDEDAKAVLEFITKRDLKLDFVTKSKELLKQYSNN